VEFEQLCRVAREQRVRIRDLRDADLVDDDVGRAVRARPRSG
jgi:hypothetical protein